MTHRQLTALLALGGVFLAVYLTLYHYGYIGALACGTGGCETVQSSNYANFLGKPVALWGVAYYLAVLAVAVAGTVGDADERRWPSGLLLVLNGCGVIFSGYLTWAEVARIHAICRYCVASAILVVVLFVISALDWRAHGDATAAEAP